MMNSADYLKSFCEDRKHLIRKYASTWGKVKIVEIDSLPVLEIPSPQLLAGFSSYLKYRCKRKKVYFRGEKDFHSSTIPSLFRNINCEIESEIKNRKKAFDDLVNTLPQLYTSKRFKKEDFRPLLQHYGIRTDWIDLVDNIFVALWFSNNRSDKAFSYIKFFIDTNLVIKNLREENSSLSLRAHCQHGFSATKRVTEWNVESLDFKNNMIAIAKLPNIPEMQLHDYVFSDEYMFPNEELDNTFKLLRKEKFQIALNKITSRNGIGENALGMIK